MLKRIVTYPEIPVVGYVREKDLRLNKKNVVWKPPPCINFSLRVRLSWNGKFIFFLEKWKCKLSRPTLSDSNLVSARLPSQFSAPFLAIQTNCTKRQWSQQDVKKKKKRKRKKPAFRICFWNPGELWDRTFFLFFFSLRPGSHELRHSNYCSNFESYYETFSTTTLVYWKNYHDSVGVTRAQYELRGLLWFRFGGADSIVNNDDIGLLEHLSW